MLMRKSRQMVWVLNLYKVVSYDILRRREQIKRIDFILKKLDIFYSNFFSFSFFACIIASITVRTKPNNNAHVMNITKSTLK